MAVNSDELSELPSGLQQSPVPGQERQSSRRPEFLHEHELGQSPADHNQMPLQSQGTMTVHGSRTQPFLMMAIQVTDKQERGSHILCLHGSH